MEHKILIADDSLTIQKVIKITLANEPFELRECSEAEKLGESLKSVNPAMVLLDFNLSENKTGYDLCREIKAHNPRTNVLMLFGTFDTIDEELLNDCGCNYHIVKPFDGTKFINLCRTMATDFESDWEDESPREEADFSMNAEEKESFEEEEQSLPEKMEFDDSSASEDDWVVNQPEFEEEEIEDHKVESFESPENKLAQEVENWGMEVPSIIGQDQDASAMEIPGVIGDSPETAEPESLFDEEEASLPKSADLEYPDLGVMTSENEQPEAEGSAEPQSKLIPLNDLKVDEASDYFELETSSEGGTDTDEALENLKEQINDEVEEEDLWAADIVEGDVPSQEENALDEENESESFKPLDSESMESFDMDDLPKVEPDKLKKAVEQNQQGTPEDFPADVMEETSNYSAQAPDLSAMKSEIQALLEKELSDKLAPLVEGFVKDYCKNHIEKVAWEVIPDLAENIIKKEIQKISDSLMDQ